MEAIDTAYNEFILCPDCESGNPDIVATSEFYCPMWSKEVKNVGICKYYRKLGNTNGNSED